MKKAIKNFLKNRFYYHVIKDRFNPQVQVSQRQLYLYYRECVAKGTVPKLNETGYRVFSQFEEDGLLMFIFAVIGENAGGTFIDIGSDDGLNSNCANLAFHFGWHGLFIDANPESIRRGQKFYEKHPHKWTYKPKFCCSKVTRENINELISRNGFSGDVDLLTVDIDGNDYWIWDALSVVSPNVVIIETHVEFGLNNIVVPYDSNYVFPGKHPVYHGASPVAMAKLGEKKGYRLVGANKYGFNFIFVKKGLGDGLIPGVSVESVLGHPSVTESFSAFDEIKDWPYMTP